jgi:DNA-directed RNA polymerase specialized sigma24 family protein
MEDRQLVEALRARDPIAMGAVYDEYAERLYGYCWFQLRNSDAAQVAFRDTLMCAEAHIGRLRSPARFGPWLYALARIECRRRRPAGPVQPDLPVARHDQDDVDLRLMAWRAVTGLPSLSRELLDLRHRHGLADSDIALVVGTRTKEVGELLGQAAVLLEAALIAEILAHDGLEGCSRRAALLRPRKDVIDDDLREALVRHSLECPRCARHLPENIAPRKVYALLPRAPLPPTLRGRLMNCFTDPELAGYRLFAAARVSRFGAPGFPQQPGTGPGATLRRASEDTSRGWPRALTAAAGALIAAVTTVAVCGYVGDDTLHGPDGVVAAPPGARSPRPSPAPPSRPSGARPVSAALPLALPDPAGSAALGAAPPKDYLWAPADEDLDVRPGRLTLPAGGAGVIVLSCPAGAVDWQAAGGWPAHLSPAAGTLRCGVAQLVTVRAPADGSGSTVVTFWPGGHQVEIVWGGRPPYPPSTPTPVPVPTEPAPQPSEPSPSRPSPSEPPPGQSSPPGAPAPSSPGRPESPQPPPSRPGPTTAPPQAAPESPPAETAPADPAPAPAGPPRSAPPADPSSGSAG